MRVEHGLGKTEEIERLYYKLSTPRNRSRLCVLLYFFIIPLFIFVGGVTFFLSELAASEEAELGIAQLCVAERKALMERLKALLDDNLSANSYAFRNFTNTWQSIHDTVIEIENCHRKRLFELLPVETFVFRNAILYSFGVYTTIGYGNLFPRTIKGRMLTVVYAVIGIPLNVAFISDLGELIARAEAESSRSWNYVDSLYYTFTTSTLIGLGDFTPQPTYVQFFVLMPLFFITETIFALVLGFITHLYRYESVILYKLIKHKIMRFLLHRRIERIKSVRQAENLRIPQELHKLNIEEISTAKAPTAPVTNAEIDAEIAELSAREMRIDKKIDKDIQMLEAMPSQIDLGILNARMKGAKFTDLGTSEFLGTFGKSSELDKLLLINTK
uniref:Potassium channel domain-containing protein n=1 Tax=Setaria digitata TaxID=48799 RepID=A0A915PTM7_9BILA